MKLSTNIKNDENVVADRSMKDAAEVSCGVDVAAVECQWMVHGSEEAFPPRMVS